MKHVGFVATLAVASLVFPPAPNAQATPILSTPSGTANVGETFVLPISITGAVDVWSWQFDLSFDPTIVRATAVTEGPFLSSFGTTIFSPGVIDNAAGLVSLVTGAYVGLPPNPSGDGVLATIEFEALAPGVPAFLLSNAFLNLLPVGFEVDNEPHTVVPEPATLLALTSGLLLMHARRIIRRPRRG